MDAALLAEVRIELAQHEQANWNNRLTKGSAIVRLVKLVAEVAFGPSTWKQ